MRKPAIYAYGSLVIVESILWFSVLTIIGVSIALGGSPLPWASLLFLFTAGMGSAWIFGGSKGDAITVAIYQGVVALFVVYFTVAAGTVGDTWSFKIAWPVDMFGGTYGGEGAFDLIFGLIAAGALWYRSQNIVSGGDISRLLSRAFKIGTATIAVALIVQLQVDINTGISALLLPFFGASLIGMAVSRLPQTEDVGNASWPTVIAISVFAILGLGIVGGLITGRYGNVGVRGLVNLWGVFVDALLWVLRYPIELAMTVLWRLILWLKSMFASEEAEEEAPIGEIGESIVDEVNARADNATDFAVDAIRWPLSILLLVVLFFVLVFAYRRYSARDNGDGDDDRESIRGEADAKADMMRLLGGLVPNWMKRGKQRALWKWPEGEKGIAEAFLLYFDTLAHAIKRGMIFDPNVTPNERVSALIVFLPGAPIETVTSRFNAACYGAQPADIDELERLRIEIDAAAKKPKPEDRT